MDVRPVTLRGAHVVLEPLSVDHVDGLWAIADEGGLWTYMGHDVASRGDLGAWVEARTRPEPVLEKLPFAIRCLDDDRLAGSTSLFDIDAHHATMEVGHTWLGAPYRRRAINTEAKRLLLAHAFETLGARRVQLKSDARNQRSRDAMERIGAHFEGILRQHTRLPDGTWRDTSLYSITADDWPHVRDRLDAMLARPVAGS